MKRRYLRTGETSCIVCDENPCICNPPPRKKCDTEGICGSLKRHLNQEANRGRGLSAFVLTDLDGHSPLFRSYRFAGVTFRDSAADNGVLINFCPWCGVSLEHFLRGSYT